MSWLGIVANIMLWWFALIVFIVLIHWLCRSRRGLPKDEAGNHHGDTLVDMIACTKGRYGELDSESSDQRLLLWRHEGSDI